MTSGTLVSKLLENDDIGDPSEYVHNTGSPSKQLAHALLNELLDKGWCRINVEKSEEADDAADDIWSVSASVIDDEYRAAWDIAGARVIPAPEENSTLRARLISQFRAGAKRADILCFTAQIVSLRPAYGALDLTTIPNDRTKDSGDWNVEIEIQFALGPKFWSKSSEAHAYYAAAESPGATAQDWEASLARSRAMNAFIEKDDDIAWRQEQQRERERKAEGSADRLDSLIARWRAAGADRNNLSDYLEGTNESMKSLLAAGMLGAASLTGHSADRAPAPAPAQAQQVRQESPEAVLMRYENSKDNPKGGYDKSTGRWYPHRSLEGGADTIAYGHKLQKGEDFSRGLTDAEAIALLRRDISTRERVITRYLPAYPKLPQYVKNAVISAWYRGDLGPRATPKTLRLMNNGDWRRAAQEYLKHGDYTGGPSGVRQRMADNAQAFARYAKEVGQK